MLVDVHPRSGLGITDAEEAASLKGLWLVDSQSGRGEQTSMKEGAVEEKREKQGKVEINHYTLTPTSGTACCPTKGTECCLHQ